MCKTAKEDELGSFSAKGNFPCSIKGHKQSNGCYDSSLLVRKKKGAYECEGWAHGNDRTRDTQAFDAFLVDGEGCDREAFSSIISHHDSQHSLHQAQAYHQPHQAPNSSTGLSAAKDDRSKNTLVPTTPGIIPSVTVKPTEYIPGKENGPVLIDTLSGKNELINVAYLNRDVPNLYPIVGVPKGIPAGIAIPSPVPLDLPPLGGIKTQKHLRVDRFQQEQSSSRRQHATFANQSIPLSQQFTSHDHNNLPLEFSDPQVLFRELLSFIMLGTTE